MQAKERQTIRFSKMHGLGNDFMVVDGVTKPIELAKEAISDLAHRQFGIGFDQLLLVEPPASPELDFNYRIFNVDGGEVEHCGNGARCFAAFIYAQGLSINNPLRVGTVNRTLTLHTLPNGEITVDMGVPETAPELLPLRALESAVTYSRQLLVEGRELHVEFGAISMGNPHAVIKVSDLDNTAVKEIGEALGAHPDFPEGVNVGFMEIIDKANIRLRVFERGTGETLACGTGACAAVVSGQLRGLLSENVKVSLPGGQLNIQWKNLGTSVMMTGPASKVYEGTVEL